MHKKNLSVLFFIFSALIASCDFISGIDSSMQAELDSQRIVNAQLADSIVILKARFDKQNETLVSILTELASISNRAARLSLSPESPASELELAEHDLNSIRNRIDALEKEAAKTRRLSGELAIAQKTITQLRDLVGSLDKEIARLKGELAVSKETIAAQGKTINGQQDSIQRQMRDITKQRNENSRLRSDYAQLFYDAGKKISTIADEGNFKITGRRNRESVANYRRSMYEDALQFYLEAASKSLPGAVDSVISMRVKIFELGGKP